MKEILVTVGTTHFNKLIKYIDDLSGLSEYKIKLQIGNGSYLPKNWEYVRFIERIENEYLDSDYIITHAGAGSIYKLLEMKKKIIVVPNLDRLDKHQVEISQFVSRNNYALVCYDLNELQGKINIIQYKEFNIYYSTYFSYDESLKEIVDSALGA